MLENVIINVSQSLSVYISFNNKSKMNSLLFNLIKHRLTLFFVSLLNVETSLRNLLRIEILMKLLKFFGRVHKVETILIYINLEIVYNVLNAIN